MNNILFLCPHGGAKSVMAASWFNRLAEEHALPYVATAAAAEDPYEAVPEPVAAFLQRDGVDVHAFVPRPVEERDVSGAARVIGIGCDLEFLGVPRSSSGSSDSPDSTEELRGTPRDRETPPQVERWDGVPQASEDLEGSAAAIRRHVEALAEELRGRR